MLRTLAILAALAATPLLHAAPPIAPKLVKGVNLSHWWWQSNDPTDKQITDADVKLIKSSGLTHVRIPIDPARFVTGDKLNTDTTNKFLKSIKLFTDAGLAVVVDAHLTGTSNKAMLPSGNAAAWEDELTKFWKTFAPALKSTPSELVAIELLNEPNGLDDAKAWPAAQERIRAAVRTILPRHTIVLTGDDWGGIDGLLHLTASKDANTVYSFHFYDPHTFTHQGATWGSPMWLQIKGLRYPFDAANPEAAMSTTTDPKAINSIKAYAREKWDAERIKARMNKAKDWAVSQSPPVTLYLGEFGAYKSGCDAESRKAWMTDVRTAAESANIGWCVWDYAGGFSITDRGAKGQRVINTDAAQALGLTTNSKAVTPKTPRKP